MTKTHGNISWPLPLSAHALDVAASPIEPKPVRALFSEISAHLMCVTPTAHWLEYVDWANPVLAEPIAIRDGHVLTPDRPGSGVEWDEAAVKRYLIE